MPFRASWHSSTLLKGTDKEMPLPYQSSFVTHRPQVRKITVRVGFDRFARAPLLLSQRFTGVLMKSRLLSSTPQWRRMSYAVVQWK
jgi:hypothetical protein